MSEDVKKEENKKDNKKVGLKLYVVLFFVVYAILQIGFTGLYTYTTIGSLFTCLMYFSIFTVMTLIYMFFKFRKNTLNEDEIKSILKRMFKIVTVIIVIFSVFLISKYLYNMFGIKNEKENFKLPKVEQVIESKIENIIETVEEETDSMSDAVSMVSDMLDYNTAVQQLDGVYTEMKNKLPAYIGFRVLTDVIDVLVSAGVIFIAGGKIITMIKLKDDIENKDDKKENKKSKKEKTKEND